MNGRFLINRRDAKVMGVAAGLADFTGVDPLLIRLGFVGFGLGLHGNFLLLGLFLVAYVEHKKACQHDAGENEIHPLFHRIGKGVRGYFF